MKIYNTLTKRIEVFKPITSKRINFFVCGPTVYDYAHLGNAKTYTQFDFIVKYLRYRGYSVFYLQNITDIDDKIIKKAQSNKLTYNDIADKYTDIFLEDMHSLGNTAVSQYAKATDYIAQIISQIKRLEKSGMAYRNSDGIYYEIKKFNNYGKLSGRVELRENDGVSRIDVSEEKKGWNDFCLWKFSKSNEPYWDTELGKGRPGWHIEDTAITESFFGSQYDVHGGAIDLIFPHHEAEIAQMEAISNRSPFVKYWMHTGFLNTKNIKMSKSLGNFLTIREVLKKYNFRILRLFYLSAHYRSTIEFSNVILEQYKNSLKRIDEFVFNIQPDLQSDKEKKDVSMLRKNVVSALDNDFDTPKAMALVFNFIKERNINKKSGVYTLNFLREINEFFGFFEFQNYKEVEIESLIKNRDVYRKAKDYKKADKIKDALLSQGVQLYDSETGTKWRRVSI